MLFIMSKSKVFIIKNTTLFSILSEISDELPFSSFFFETHDLLISYLKSNQVTNFLVIGEITINDTIKKENILDIKNFPVSIFKLIEQINVKLLQSNYKLKSSIKLKDYIINLNSRIISKNDKKLKLTQKEIDIILHLKNNNQPKNVQDLQKDVWSYSDDLETHTVETHVYRLRKKISETFGDNNLINSSKEGYYL